MKAQFRLTLLIALLAFVWVAGKLAVLADEVPAGHITHLPFVQGRAAPATPYRLLLLSNRGGIMQVYSLWSDGSGLQRLSDLAVRSAQWSPDGTKVLFVHPTEAGDDLYIMNSDGSNARPFTTLTGDEYDAAWSPDGSQVIFLHDQADTSMVELYISDAEAPQPTLLERNSSLNNVTWSPNGGAIAYTADAFPEDTEILRFQTFVFDLAAGQEHQVTGGENGYVLHGWVNGGKRLLVSGDGPDEGHNLYTLEADGSNWLSLTTGTNEKRVYGISGDGERVAYIVKREGAEIADLFIQDLSGNSAPLPASEPFCYNSVCGLESLRFAPDSEQVAYVTWHPTSAQNCPSQLWLARSGGASPEWNGLLADVYSPVWVNQESLIVHHSGGEYGILARTPYLLDLRTGTETPLLAPDATHTSVLGVRPGP